MEREPEGILANIMWIVIILVAIAVISPFALGYALARSPKFWFTCLGAALTSITIFVVRH